MGSGSFSKRRYQTNSLQSNYADKSVAETFTKKSLDHGMNPKGISIRESRDSEEHPTSVPIILGLDVTGSMGHIPKHLITEGLGTLMAGIIERGVEHPQVLFMGLGDHLTDQAPLQVAQFESSDPLLDKWLKDVYLEGHGGGNGGESYLLAWYFAAYHTAIDSMEKRDTKGFLFTIGDDACHNEISGATIKQLMGETAVVEQDSFHATELLQKAKELYHVKHIHVQETTTGSRAESSGYWYELMEDDVIVVNNHMEIPKVIAKTILEIQTGSAPEQIEEVETQTDTENEQEVIL